MKNIKSPPPLIYASIRCFVEGPRVAAGRPKDTPFGEAGGLQRDKKEARRDNFREELFKRI